MNKAATARRKSPKKNTYSSRLVSYLSPGRIFIGGSLLFTVVIMAVLALNSMGKEVPKIDFSIPDSSEVLAVLESPHLRQGEQPPTYDSNPPTSGAHNPRPANWGIYGAVLPDDTVVHNLEHGGIWISYRDKDPETIRQLEDIARRYPRM